MTGVIIFLVCHYYSVASKLEMDTAVLIAAFLPSSAASKSYISIYIYISVLDFKRKIQPSGLGLGAIPFDLYVPC